MRGEEDSFPPKALPFSRISELSCHLWLIRDKCRLVTIATGFFWKLCWKWTWAYGVAEDKTILRLHTRISTYLRWGPVIWRLECNGIYNGPKPTNATENIWSREMSTKLDDSLSWKETGYIIPVMLSSSLSVLNGVLFFAKMGYRNTFVCKCKIALSEKREAWIARILHIIKNKCRNLREIWRRRVLREF